MIRVSAGLTLVFVGLTLIRGLCAFVFLAKARAGPRLSSPPLDQLTILQPILSGDPDLERSLQAALAACQGAKFIWLVDEDDPEAQRIALGAPRQVRTLIGPPPAQGENPKTAKLARGLAEVHTPFFAVLDDDTVPPLEGTARAMAAVQEGGLATGLPLYLTAGGVWSGLLSAFVNGSALITYPPVALLGAPRTINGMFYVGRTDELRRLGGFAAIRGSLTDDYALASLYRRAGASIVQTAVVHPIRTDVIDPGHYSALMRRWMIFGLRFFRGNLSAVTIGLIAVPTLLPPLVLGLAAASGPAALAGALGALFAKALMTGALRRRFAGARITGEDVLFEVAADLLTPFHILAAGVRPNVFTWRGRKIRMAAGDIHYE